MNERKRLEDAEAAAAPTPIWDRATRAWHWVVAAMIPAMWYTAEEHMFAFHRTLGICLAGLLVFRLTWGVVGSRTARFTSFLPTPGRTLAYAKSMFSHTYVRTIGHNPLGGLSVIAMILALLVQVGTGLFAVDTDGINSGPLSHLVDFKTGRDIADIHETSFNILLALIVLHLAAITFYFVAKHINLISPMITGKVRAPGEGNTKPGPFAFLFAAALAAGTTYYLFTT